MSNSVSQSKRPRVELPATISMNPYEMYQQPGLYKNFYQDNTGGDRSIHASAIVRNTYQEMNADFNLIKVDTTNWPRTYDNRPHKCIYNLTQFGIYMNTEDGATDNTTNGKLFGAGTQKQPYALVTQIQNGACNASTEVKKRTTTGFNDSQFPQVIASFKPINSQYTLKAASATTTKFNYDQVSETFEPGVATFSGTYPAPSTLHFALVQLTADPNTYMKLSNSTVIFMQFLITLLD